MTCTTWALCSSSMYTLWKICKHLHRLHKYKKFVPKLFLTPCVNILGPLSLNVKLHHYNLFIYLSAIVIKVWPQLLVEGKKMQIITNL
jgi:hypothetical protein